MTPIRRRPIELLANNNTQDVQARILRTFQQFPQSGTITAWIYVPKLPTIQYNLIELGWDITSDGKYLDVIVTSDGHFQVRALQKTSGLGAQLTTNIWVQLTVTFDLTKNELKLTTSLDDATLAAPDDTSFAWGADKAVEIDFGLESTDASKGQTFAIFYDDITLSP